MMQSKVYTSTTGFLKVTFTSDSYVVWTGWQVKWIAIADPACINCEEGKYSGSGAEVCIDCVPDTYSQAGASVCIDCVPGTYLQAGASFCTTPTTSTTLQPTTF